MDKFTIDKENIEAQMSYGSEHISSDVKVEGFWGNPIDIRIKRGWNWDRKTGDELPAGWEFEVTHSSGGTGRGTDSLVTERNFAAALLAVCDYVDTLKACVPDMEAAYQFRMAEYERERKAEQAAKQAKIDADPEIGLAAARAYIEALVANTRVSNGQRFHVLRAKVRGADHTADFVACKLHTDRVVLRMGGSAIGAKQAWEKLAGYAQAGLVADVVLDDDAIRELHRSYNL